MILKTLKLCYENKKHQIINIRNNRIMLFIRKYILILLGFFFVIISVFVLLIVKYYLIYKEGSSVHISKEYIDFNYYLSSAFNNWISPFVAIIAAFLTFLAFFAQYKTNLDQYDRIKELDSNNKLQNFENIFFKLLENHHRLVESLSYNFKTNSINIDENTRVPQTIINNDIREGLLCLISFIELLNSEVEKGDLQQSQIIDAYNKLFEQHHSFLSHLIRSLYLFVKFIDEKELLKSASRTFNDGEDEVLTNLSLNKNIVVEEKRYEFLKILRAQLSSDLIVILSLNAFTSQGRDFEFYIRKYRLLKNISLSTLNINIQRYLIVKYPHIESEIEE